MPEPGSGIRGENGLPPRDFESRGRGVMKHHPSSSSSSSFSFSSSYSSSSSSSYAPSSAPPRAGSDQASLSYPSMTALSLAEGLPAAIINPPS